MTLRHANFDRQIEAVRNLEVMPVGWDLIYYETYEIHGGNDVTVNRRYTNAYEGSYYESWRIGPDGETKLDKRVPLFAWPPLSDGDGSSSLQPRDPGALGRRAMVLAMPRLADFPYDLVRLQCSKCGRRGQYRKTTLIERFGADQRAVDLLAIVSADCPKRQANKITDLCECTYDFSRVRPLSRSKPAVKA